MEEKRKIRLEDDAADGDVTQVLIDKAIETRLLLRLRRATYYMPDGRKAGKASIIGKNLSDAQLLEVWGKLSKAKKSGIPVYDMLAEKIQKDWNQLTQYSRWAVTRALQFYEQRIFGLLGIVDTVPEMKEWAETKMAAVRKINKKVDGIKELSNLIKIQTGRIESAVLKEQKSKKLTTFLYKEFSVAEKLIKTYMEYQLEFGLVTRQPHKLQVGPLDEGFRRQKQAIEQTIGTNPMIQATTKMIEMIESDDGVFDAIEVSEEELSKQQTVTKQPEDN